MGADVGDLDVGLGALALEVAEDDVVRILTSDEPLGGVLVPLVLDPDDPVAGPGQEGDLAGPGVDVAPVVVDLDLPA